MNADNLLDAFGLIDDRFLVPERKARAIPWRRRFTVLVAAVLIMALCVGTAMAISEDFRSFVFSIFQIETHHQPPATEATHPTEPGLHGMDIVNIDGEVNAYYFSSGGYVMVTEGGFFTCEWHGEDTAPDSPAFWEITTDGIVEVDNTRVDFPFTQVGKTFRIRFDYAVLNGKLSIQTWPEGLNEDPVGKAWNVTAFGNRTDAALLTIPVLSNNDYTHDLFLLDLTTLEATELIVDTPQSGVIAYGHWVTDDLRYGIIAGVDLQTNEYDYWLYDLQTDTMTAIDSLMGRNVENAYFLNENTMVLTEKLDDGRFNMVRYHIPSGVQRVILENVSSKSGRDTGYRPIQNHGADGAHGLLFREDGSVDLMDFKTQHRLKMTGLDTEKLTCDESPDGSRIMLAYEEEKGFTSLGILDPETGVLKMLDRDVSGGSEDFRGWLDNNTLVITAHDETDADLTFTPGDGYYVYVYRFQDTEPPDPAVTEPAQTAPPEPADDDLVRITDYIPDIAVDLRYATDNNFTGRTIYDFTQPLLRYGTVKKLMQAQAYVKQDGLCLKIWDGFRPASAQFRLWEVCPDPRYVADPNNGFSSHSRGNTVDVTLVYADGTDVKMPTGYDDFSALADRDYSDCDAEAAANARYLEQVMQAHGFKSYWAEWWHYTDTDPYPAAA